MFKTLNIQGVSEKSFFFRLFSKLNIYQMYVNECFYKVQCPEMGGGEEIDGNLFQKRT